MYILSPHVYIHPYIRTYKHTNVRTYNIYVHTLVWTISFVSLFWALTHMCTKKSVLQKKANERDSFALTYMLSLTHTRHYHTNTCTHTHASVYPRLTSLLGNPHTATHGNTLQHAATRCNTLQHAAAPKNMLQHPATHCNTLQHTATHSNTLQHTATHCNTLQHTATHYNTLQHSATHSRDLRLWLDNPWLPASGPFPLPSGQSVHHISYMCCSVLQCMAVFLLQRVILTMLVPVCASYIIHVL